jgi:hypothetical protein
MRLSWQRACCVVRAERLEPRSQVRPYRKPGWYRFQADGPRSARLGLAGQGGPLAGRRPDVGDGGPGASQCPVSCMAGSHAGSQADERHSGSPDSREQRAAARPGSRTDLNGSGCPHRHLRQKGERRGCRPCPAAYGLSPPLFQPLTAYAAGGRIFPAPAWGTRSCDPRAIAGGVEESETGSSGYSRLPPTECHDCVCPVQGPISVVVRGLSRRPFAFQVNRSKRCADLRKRTSLTSGTALGGRCSVHASRTQYAGPPGRTATSSKEHHGRRRRDHGRHRRCTAGWVWWIRVPY